MVRHPSYAFRKIIPKPAAKPIWNRTLPTALERTVYLINSSPAILFARKNDCPDSKRIQELLKNKLSYRLVYLDDLSMGNIMQRRLQDLTGQWTVPNLFVNGQSVGGLNDTKEALNFGKIEHLLNGEADELVYSVKPDELARKLKIKEKSTLSFRMGLQDSHKFAYVHKERWAKIKRYLGKHPAIEDYK